MMNLPPFPLHVLLTVLFTQAMSSWQPLLGQAQPAHPPYPDVQEMIREPFDDFPNGTIACGWEALRHRMRGNIYRSNPGRLDDPRLTQFERRRARIWQDLGTHPSDIRIYTDAKRVTARINGDEMPVVREERAGQTVWLLDPYGRLPRVRDRVGTTRPSH